MTTATLPDAELLHNAVLDCLLTKEEADAIPEEDMLLMAGKNGNPADGSLFHKHLIYPVSAVIARVGLRKDRVEKYRQLVIDCIKALPPPFYDQGESFLLLCQDKDGRQWGEHRNADDLIILALALGMCKFPIPRPAWDVLPGGMPIVRFVLPKEG